MGNNCRLYGCLFKSDLRYTDLTRYNFIVPIYQKKKVIVIKLKAVSFNCPNEVREEDIQMWIKEMSTLPSHIKALTVSLDKSK
ncbi:hypothetical protein GCM10008934_03690 [Virgibacillus salarius]